MIIRKEDTGSVSTGIIRAVRVDSPNVKTNVSLFTRRKGQETFFICLSQVIRLNKHIVTVFNCSVVSVSIEELIQQLTSQLPLVPSRCTLLTLFQEFELINRRATGCTKRYNRK